MNRRACLAAVAILWLAGCATARAPGEPVPDALEGFNRPVFAFNDALDRWVLHPLGKGWDWITPRTVPIHLEQLIDNLRTPSYMLNDLFQGDVRQSGVEFTRFTVNTAFGLAGIFDPASHFLAFEGRPEDFGQTLGVWGAGQGAYVMLPIMGPYGVRELAALPVDLALNPLNFVPGANLVSAVNLRSMHHEEVVRARKAALDWYVFVRNAYRQVREALVRNGEVEEETPSDEFYDLDE